MKRSEVLSRLKEEFIKYENPDGIAARALSVVENLGMKPPERPFWNRQKDGSLKPHAKNGEMVNSWDEE